MGVARKKTITNAGKQTKFEIRTAAAVCRNILAVSLSARASEIAGTIDTANDAVKIVAKFTRGTAIPVK